MASVVALGNFDGLHLGHMAVINEAKSMAERLHAMPFALSFKEHPMAVLTGEAPVSLFTNDVRAMEFKATGVTLCLLDFASMKDMTPKEFFEQIIVKRMGAVGVCCGFNYSFGKGGKGSPKQLKKFCEDAGIEFSMLPEQDFEGQPISSTRIRTAIENGEIELANMMLGHPFTYRQTVVGGDKRGRLLDTPTINQFLSPELVEPKHGVYMSKTTVHGRKYYSVTNIGIRPTIGDDRPVSSETHILDFNGDIYGMQVEVSLLHYLRPEKKFDSINELKAQIEEDIRQVREICKKLLYNI